MDIKILVIFLLIGALVGWLAGTMMRGRGFGLIINIFIGTVGVGIGGFLLRFLAITVGNYIDSMVTAAMGAVVLLYIIGLPENRNRSLFRIQRRSL